MGSFHPESFLRPSQTDEVVKLLLREKDRARIIAGGTTVYEMANRGLLADVVSLVDISKLGLRHITKNEKNKTLSIGASVTFTQMLENAVLARDRRLAAIRDALTLIKPVQVRNVATIAGSVCSGIPLFDLPVALMAADARVVVQGLAERIVDLKSFLGAIFMVDLREGEFVRGFEIPLREKTWSSFEKFAVTGDDWAMVNCATRLGVDSKNSLHECRIILGGGVTKVSRAKEAEKMAEGLRPSMEALESVVSSAVNSAEFVNDARGSESYRKRVAAYLLNSSFRRTLQRMNVDEGGR